MLIIEKGRENAGKNAQKYKKGVYCFDFYYDISCYYGNIS